MRMLFASCVECDEPTSAPDGLCSRCRVTPKSKRPTTRREQTQTKTTRRR
jgi:hypothetical protein